MKQKGWGEPLRRRQHLRKEPWGHFVSPRYQTSPEDLQEKRPHSLLMLQPQILLLQKNKSSRSSSSAFSPKNPPICCHLKDRSVKGSEMVIPPLSFVWNRKTIQTEVGFRQSGGKLRPLKRTLPHRRRKKNKISRFSMSKRQDRVGGGKESEFSQHGGIFRKLNWWLLLTHTYTHPDTNFPTLLWAHTCSKFLCCLGDRGELQVPNKNAWVSFN